MNDNRERLIALLAKHGIWNNVAITDTIMAEFPGIGNQPPPIDREMKLCILHKIIDYAVTFEEGTRKHQSQEPNRIFAELSLMLDVFIAQPALRPLDAALRGEINAKLLAYGEHKTQIGKDWNKHTRVTESIIKGAHMHREIMALIDAIAAPVAPVVLPTRSDALMLCRDKRKTGSRDWLDRHAQERLIQVMVEIGYLAEDDPEPEAVEPDIALPTERIEQLERMVDGLHSVVRKLVSRSIQGEGMMGSQFDKLVDEQFTAALSAATDSGEGTVQQ